MLLTSPGRTSEKQGPFSLPEQKPTFQKQKLGQNKYVFCKTPDLHTSPGVKAWRLIGRARNIYIFSSPSEDRARQIKLVECI